MRNVRKARPGFALIMVLFVMIMGLAMTGATFSLYSSFSNRTVRATDFWGDKNRMDEGLERGRLALAKWSDENGGGMPEACFKKRVETDQRVRTTHDLRIAAPASDADAPWEPADLEYMLDAAGGRKLSVKIEIFDVNYTVDQLHDELLSEAVAAAAARAKLPLAIEGEGNYLIRSTTKVVGESCGTVTEMALCKREDG